MLNVIVNGDQGRAEMQKLERTITDLGTANERLEQKQRKLEAAGKSGSQAWQKNKAAIESNNAAMQMARERLEQLRKGLDLTNMSIRDLQREQGRLTQLMRNATPGTENFAKYSIQLEKVKARIAELNGKAKSTGLSLGKLADGLNRYVGVITAGFATFALLVTGARAAGNAYAQLDDKVADVMKTTGLAEEVVYDMNESLSKVDTRTAQLELLGLAQQAGKLGISARRDVEDFVLAADKIGVALGEDLGDKEEAIRQIGKIVDLFKVKEEFGMGDGMLKVGSVINALGAASTANEGYIVDFTKRLGGIAVPAKMSVTQVAGLGATLDALGQASEASSTAVSKVLTGMFRKTSEYAKVAGMDVKAFKNLMTEDMNEAFIKVLEGMQGGGLDRVVAMLGDLGENGARVTTSLGTLASNTQKLREQQALANDEFAKGTSVLNEYETKNNSAQAQLEKAQKSFQQRLVELGKSLQPVMTYTTTGFSMVVKGLTAAIKGFKEYKDIIVAATAIVVGYITVKKLLLFYSAQNRIAMLREVVTIKSATAATQLLAAAKLLLAGQVRAAAIAFKAFWVSIGPVGWLVTAVSAAVTAMALFGNKTREAAGAIADMVMQLGQERDTYDDLQKALYASTEGSQARADVIKLINERYGEYLDNLLTEKSSTEDIATALEEASRKMEENIKVKIRSQELERIRQEQFDAEKQALQELMDKYKEKGNKTVEQQKLAAQQFEGLIRNLKETGDNVGFVRNAMRLLGRSEQEFIDATNGRGKAAGDYRTLWGVLQDIVTASKNATSALSILDAMAGGVAKQANEIPLEQLQARLDEINDRLSDNGIGEVERKRLEGMKGSLENQIKAIEDAREKLNKNSLTTTNNNNDDDGTDWSLDSDEAFMGKKIALKRKLWQGEIATEAEYNRQLLALEIEALQARLDANIEDGEKRSKLQMDLLDRQYQQTKNEQARTEKLLAAARTPYESEVADYEKRLKELGLFGIEREQMTEDQQRALLKLENEHRDKLYNLWLNGLSKQEAKRKEKNDAELRELRTKQNNELAAATTLEQKKAILRRWFSDADLQRVSTNEQAQKIITAKYQEEEQQMLKKHLEDTIATYNLLLSGAINPLFALGLTPEMRAKMQAELDKLQEELSKVNLNISQGDATADTDITKGKSNIDILGFSEDQWASFFGKSDKVMESIDKWNMALQAVGNTFGMISDMMTAAENKEFRKYEQTANRKKKVLEQRLKSGTISQERYNDAVRSIDEETDAKREEMERKQAKRQKELAIFQAITNTAIGITAALTSIPPNPAMAWVVGAIGALQLATILATPLPGFEEGGLIGVEREQDGKRYRAGYDPNRRGVISRPTVLVGENGTEYVVPAEGYENPTIRPVLDVMERARRSGTIREINLPAALAASGVIPGRAVGGYVGGTAPVSEPTVSSAANAVTGYDDGVLRELKEVVGKLSRQLEKPIPTYISYLGRDGIATIQKKLEQQQRRAGIGGK